MDTTLNRKMKAIVQQQPGPASTLEVGEVDIPIPKENEVLIKVEYTALNRADIMQRNGAYPPPAGASKIIGLECLGYIINDIETDLVNESYKQNPLVMALLSGGGYAQFATVHKDHVIPIPQNLKDNLSLAAAIPEVWLTAFQLLVQIANVQEGDRVLIHAAASGVGTSLIQLCKKYGAIAIASASQDEKLQKCKVFGADFVINYKKTPEFSKVVQEYTGGKGVDIILDPVSAQNFHQNLASIALDGRWVFYGSLGGMDVDINGQPFNLRPLMGKRLNLHWTTLRNRTDDYKSKLIKRFMKECLPDFESGKLQPIVDKEFNLSDIVQAHEYMEKNENIGKLVIKNDLV